MTSAMDELFWTDETDLETVLCRMGISVSEKTASILQDVFSCVWQARRKYQSNFARLGIVLGDVEQVLERQWDAWPIAYEP